MTQHRALITGASAGLGAEFARQLAAQGMDLVLVARRTELMHALANDLRASYGIEVLVVSADLSDPAAPAAIYNEVTNHGLHVDYLVNNAGSAGPDFLTDRDWEKQRTYLELMMMSVPAMCHYFIPEMRRRQFGRIVNVASVAGRMSRVGDCSYGPAKAYVVAFSEGLGVTLRREGIHVLALCPGLTHTEFHNTSRLKKMKASTAKFLWYDAEVVVREGLGALERGKTVYSSGRLYRFFDPFFQSVWTRGFFSALKNNR